MPSFNTVCLSFYMETIKLQQIGNASTNILLILEIVDLRKSDNKLKAELNVNNYDDVEG